jgi:hypothetical protein
MPGPPVGVVLLGPGAVAAAKHVAFQISTVVDLQTFASAATLSILCYWCFSRLPDWVRNDLSYRNLLRNRKDVSKEEISGLITVVDKIQQFLKSIKEGQNMELDDIPQLHAAVLAFIQVSGQLKLQQINRVNNNRKRQRQEERGDDHNGDDDDTSMQQPQKVKASATADATPRDSVYEAAGNAVDINELRSEELQTALIMSTWAYYEDSMVGLIQSTKE